ncbi:hypothetical protein ACIQU6_44560 [Streptomyces sp. NPDC090442]|uniref:hypothetical protein n=1 Tax=Streptomyces sp. NPDC090442 TaxID=3365962 RepID=UPI00380F43C9
MRMRLDGSAEDVQALVAALRAGKQITILHGQYGPYENHCYHKGDVHLFLDVLPPVDDLIESIEQARRSE